MKHKKNVTNSAKDLYEFNRKIINYLFAMVFNQALQPRFFAKKDNR
jgi:hypothetical protein